MYLSRIAPNFSIFLISESIYFSFQSLEAKKVADWTAKVAKIEEATRKKDELNHEFIEQTKEALEAKMEQSEEKREALLSEIKEKLKIHSQEIEKARQLIEKQKFEEREALEEKLQSAASAREEIIKKMLDRLKEHVSLRLHIHFYILDALKI